MPPNALSPVPGDPFVVGDAARTFASVAAEVAGAAARLRSLAGSETAWTGNAATKARARSATLPPRLDKVRVSYAAAGDALRQYTDALARWQQQSASAVRAADAANAELQWARAAQQAAAARDAQQATAATAVGQPAPPPTATRYESTIADAVSRLARATAANAAAHEEHQRAARTAAARLRQASTEGIHNQPWWRHALTHAASWASTTWAKSLRAISQIATTVSALAGLAALALSIAGIFFPPLEAAAAVLETVSLVSAVVGATADTALAATGKGSWTTVGIDALGLAPCIGSVAVRKAARFFRNPTVVHASTREAADISRTAYKTARTQAAERLRDLADSYRPPGSHDPLTVAVLETKSGAVYTGRSGFRRSIDPRLRAALDSVPEDVRPLFHGRCAEIDCLNQAIAAEDEVQGSVVSTARVRGLSSAAHGTAIEPCPSCAWVLKTCGGLYQP